MTRQGAGKLARDDLLGSPRLPLGGAARPRTGSAATRRRPRDRACARSARLSPRNHGAAPNGRRSPRWPGPRAWGRSPRRCTPRPAPGGCSGPRPRSPLPRPRRGRPQGTRMAGRSPKSRLAPRSATRWCGPARRHPQGLCSSSSWQPRSRLASRHHDTRRRGRGGAGRRPAGCHSAPPGGSDGRSAGSRASVSIRSSARWTRPRGRSSSSASSPSEASGTAMRSEATARTSIRQGSEPAIRLERADRGELAGRRGRAPIEIGRLGVQQAVQVAPHGPRDLPGGRLRGSWARPRSSAGRCRSSRRPSMSRPRVPAVRGRPRGAPPLPGARRGRAPRRLARRTPGGSRPPSPRASPGPGIGPADRRPDSGPRLHPSRTRGRPLLGPRAGRPRGAGGP